MKQYVPACVEQPWISGRGFEPGASATRTYQKRKSAFFLRKNALFFFAFYFLCRLSFFFFFFFAFSRIICIFDQSAPWINFVGKKLNKAAVRSLVCTKRGHFYLDSD